MASPVEMIKAVSDLTGVPLATVTDIDRRLAKADLREKGGRGTNPARMMPLDAARLLTAVLGSAQANTSAEAVQRYEATKPDKTRSSEGLFDGTDLLDLIALPQTHGFVAGLAGLLASAGSGSIAKLVRDDTCTPMVEVYAFVRATRARIRLAGLPSRMVAMVEYAPAGRAVNASADGDLEKSSRITERTILPLAKLLADGGWDA